MSIERIKERYGDEYPAAITLNGVRMTLVREDRFIRSYRSADGKKGTVVPRFMDGSATITFEEVQREWANWSEAEQRNFRYACGFLRGQPDFPSIVRLVIERTGLPNHSSLALPIAHSMPQGEAFGVLSEALRNARAGVTANLTQAIAATKHPEAERTLRDHLELLWRDGRIWEDPPFINRVAFDATCCIASLLEVGADPQGFEDKVRRLAAHACKLNRDVCAEYLHDHYRWLSTQGH